MSTRTPDHAEQLPEGLFNEKANECARKVPEGFHALSKMLQDRFGNSLQSVLLYGSCLHNYELKDSVVDMYAIVDDYGRAYESRLYQFINKFVPPNVYYMEVEHEGIMLRCKCGVISIDDFESGSRQWFHSYIWGRFAQPVRVLFTASEDARQRVLSSLANATITFLRATTPVLGRSVVDTETIWTRGLSLSYAAELRPEHKDRARQLTHLNMGDYVRLTAHAAKLIDKLEELPQGRYNCNFSERECRRALRNWTIRAWQGRVLSILRLAKAVFTFRDCVDYAAWKIARHTGVQIEVTPRLQRHPILFGGIVLWRLVKEGVMH